MKNNKKNAHLKVGHFKKHGLQSWLNACIFVDMGNWKGSSFHSLGVHTEKALSP